MRVESPDRAEASRLAREPGASGGVSVRNPAWPVTALLVGYPLWWALGVGDFIWMLLAVPMALRMLSWRVRHGRRLRVPPGFGLWLLFVVCALAGVAVLGVTAPGTVESSVVNRGLSYTNRNGNYLAVTVLLLYVGNLTDRELPRRRLAWMLGLVAIYTTAGGLAGMAWPRAQFSSPLQLVLPRSVQSNLFVQASTHPGLSQLSSTIGALGARPKAPFDYTNTWANCLTILLPWLIVGWWHAGSHRQRVIAVWVVVIAVLPLVYSVNRGAWIGAGVAVAYLALRLAARGRFGLLGALSTALALGAVIVLTTPLQAKIVDRLGHPGSIHLRQSLDSLAVTDGLASPVIGYGDTRQQQGSLSSIAQGPTAKCPRCGQLAVGSTGQLWLLLITTGFVGALFYLAFFGFGIWRFRRDRTPFGYAGVLVLLLTFVYMFAYNSVPAPLGFTMLAYALLWRNDIGKPAQPLTSGRATGPALDQVEVTRR